LQPWRFWNTRMGDWILDADEVRTARSQVANPRIYGHVSDERVLALCNTVDALRARAEKAEAEREEARRLLEHCQRRAADANMSLFGVEQDNAGLRARLESAEAACHAARRLLLWDPEEYPQCQDELRRRLKTALDAWEPVALDAAGERSEGI
jgi:chromosome segregation ATPase